MFSVSSGVQGGLSTTFTKVAMVMIRGKRLSGKLLLEQMSFSHWQEHGAWGGNVMLSSKEAEMEPETVVMEELPLSAVTQRCSLISKLRAEAGWRIGCLGSLEGRE